MISDLFYSKQIQFLKDNYALLLIIPTCIDGMNQIFNLYSLGSYYIRFFSVTQLISDGIWIMLIYIPLYACLFYLSPFLSNMSTRSFFNFFFPKLRSEGKFNSVAFFKINFLFVLMSVVETLRTNDFLLKKPTFLFTFGTISIGASLVAMIINYKIMRYLPKFVWAKHFLMTHFAFIFYFSVRIILIILNQNSIPKELVNSEIFASVPMEYKFHKQRLIYWNDNYAFYKLFCDRPDELGSKTFIVKSENIFDPQN